MSFIETLNMTADKEIEKIDAAAKMKCDDIIATAQTKSEKIIFECTRTAETEKQRALMIAESEARIRSRAETGHAFEELIDRLKDKVFAALEKKWQDDFVAIASKTFISAAEHIGSRNIVISMTPQYETAFTGHDKSIRSALAASNIILEKISFDLKSRGGVIVTSSDGRRARTESFEACFRRMEEEVRTLAAERFGRE
ncbi:MAG TPA: V-type ATP synthase subunit E family protein [Spirochaetota bacterium]